MNMISSRWQRASVLLSPTVAPMSSSLFSSCGTVIGACSQGPPPPSTLNFRHAGQQNRGIVAAVLGTNTARLLHLGSGWSGRLLLEWAMEPPLPSPLDHHTVESGAAGLAHAQPLTCSSAHMLQTPCWESFYTSKKTHPGGNC